MTFGDSATASKDRRYVYDAAWNLNYRTNNTTTYTFTVDTKNQLTNATVVGNQTYDGNGNVTSWSSGSGGSYTYDDENVTNFFDVVRTTELASQGFPGDGRAPIVFCGRITALWP